MTTSFVTPPLRFETVGKSYRKICYAYDDQRRSIGHIGWCPAAVRNRKALKREGLHPRGSAGTYAVYLYAPDAEGVSRASKIGERESLANAKAMLSDAVER